ncbi:uncharacterized protein [Anabrus simplex]|uniref:uncharacterized protein isoform X2 n=1 Tax=Anabrus simplex TaxID=316456 RepID=UPI0035A35C0B
MGIFGVLIDEMIESVTLSLSRVPLKWSSHGLAGNCSLYFDNSSVVTRISLYFTSIVFVYLLYAKCLHGFLKRMELSELSRSHFIDAVWYAAFGGIGIVACAFILMMDYNVKDLETAYKFFFKEKPFLNEIIISTNMTFVFMIFAALLIHSVCLTWSERGVEVEFFTRMCFMLFFCSTYSMRRVLLGLVCVFFINMNTVCADLARICSILGRNKSYQINSVKYVAYFFFLLHCIFWIGMFAYFLPTYVLFALLSMPTSRSNLISLLLLNLMLWSFFWLQLMSAPLSKLLWNTLWAWCNNAGQRDLLDCALFPARNEVLRELKQIRTRIQKLQEERRRSSLSSYGPTSQDPGTKKTLFQTIKCVMALKRKLKERRERKQAEQAQQSEQTEQADQDEQALQAEDSVE